MANTPTAVYGISKPAQGDTPWTTTVNGDWDSVDSEIARPRWPFNSPVVGATTTCDLSLARTFAFTVSQATTLAFTNVPSASFSTAIYLKITNGNAFLITWPAAVTWAIGNPPTLRTAGLDIVKLWTNDAGVTWYANLVTGTERPMGIVATVVTQVVSGAGSPVNLQTTTLLAGKLLTVNTGIRMRAWGSSANNANAKAVRLSFGATIVQTLTLTPSTAALWQIEATVIRTAATAQKAFGHVSFHGAAGSVGPLLTTPAETLANAIVVKTDCTQVGAGDVIQEGWFVELLN